MSEVLGTVPAITQTAVAQPATIRLVPEELGVRRRIRAEAARVAVGLSRERPLERTRLEELGRELLSRMRLERGCLGFAMVALNNEFWRDQFAAAPCSGRVLLLPHCLRKAQVCAGAYTALGLTCAGCGVCVPLCPYGAVQFEVANGTRRASVNVALCKGCGTCGAACPSAAITMDHYKDAQIIAQIEALAAVMSGG